MSDGVLIGIKTPSLLFNDGVLLCLISMVFLKAIKIIERGMMTNTGNRKTEYKSKAANLSSGSVSEKLAQKQLAQMTKLTKAIFSDFDTLLEVEETFRTNKDCINYLENLFWRGKLESPYAPNSKVYKRKNGWYKCKKTGREFNVLTGTFLENTKIKLTIWFRVIYRMNSDLRGIPAKLLVRDYGITETAALFMTKKIRYAMAHIEGFRKLGGVVETDEYSEGGSLKNMHYDKKLEAKEKPHQNKKIMQGFISRTTGDAVIHVIPDLTDTSITTGIYTYVETGSTLYTDDNPSYKKLLNIYNRKSVVHSKGNYVDKDDPEIHTNTIESLWSNFERRKKSYVHVSEKHLLNYAGEAVFRNNTKMFTQAKRFEWLMQNIQGTRITWKEIREGRYMQKLLAA